MSVIAAFSGIKFFHPGSQFINGFEIRRAFFFHHQYTVHDLEGIAGHPHQSFDVEKALQFSAVGKFPQTFRIENEDFAAFQRIKMDTHTIHKKMIAGTAPSVTDHRAGGILIGISVRVAVNIVLTPHIEGDRRNAFHIFSKQTAEGACQRSAVRFRFSAVDVMHSEQCRLHTARGDLERLKE